MSNIIRFGGGAGGSYGSGTLAVVDIVSEVTSPVTLSGSYKSYIDDDGNYNIVSNDYGDGTWHYKVVDGVYTSVSTLPGVAYYHCVGKDENNIVHLLGLVGTTKTNNYTFVDGSWTKLTDIPFGSQHSTVANDENGYLHIIGSCVTDSYAKHYKLVDGSWSACTDAPWSVGSLNYRAVRDKDGYINLLTSYAYQHYKLIDDTWVSVSTPPILVNNVTRVGDVLLCGTTTKVTYIYDGEWRYNGVMPFRITHYTSASYATDENITYGSGACYLETTTYYRCYTLRPVYI